MICNEHLELLLNLIFGDGGVGDDELNVLLLQLDLALLRPFLDPGLGENVQGLGVLPLN